MQPFLSRYTNVGCVIWVLMTDCDFTSTGQLEYPPVVCHERSEESNLG